MIKTIKYNQRCHISSVKFPELFNFISFDRHDSVLASSFPECGISVQLQHKQQDNYQIWKTEYVGIFGSKHRLRLFLMWTRRAQQTILSGVRARTHFRTCYMLWWGVWVSILIPYKLCNETLESRLQWSKWWCKKTPEL